MNSQERIEAAGKLRCGWIDVVMHMSEEDQRVEIRQLLCDVMDITAQQGDIGDRAQGAYRAFTDT